MTLAHTQKDKEKKLTRVFSKLFHIQNPTFLNLST